MKNLIVSLFIVVFVSVTSVVSVQAQDSTLISKIFHNARASGQFQMNDQIAALAIGPAAIGMANAGYLNKAAVSEVSSLIQNGPVLVRQLTREKRGERSSTDGNTKVVLVPKAGYTGNGAVIPEEVFLRYMADKHIPGFRPVNGPNGLQHTEAPAPTRRTPAVSQNVVPQTAADQRTQVSVDF